MTKTFQFMNANTLFETLAMDHLSNGKDRHQIARAGSAVIWRNQGFVSMIVFFPNPNKAAAYDYARRTDTLNQYADLQREFGPFVTVDPAGVDHFNSAVR